MRTCECPKCGEDISESYQSAEPDVGIMGSGWWCEKCDLVVDDDGYEPHDDDVPLFGMDKVHVISNRCPKCLSTELEMGYGLASGGMGPYNYCPRCQIVVNKSQDPT